MQAAVIVSPGAGRFSISVKDGAVRISLRSQPEKNKANIELLKELSRLTGRRVSLVRGATTRRKTLEIAMSAEEWLAFLSAQAPIRPSVPSGRGQDI